MNHKPFQNKKILATFLLCSSLISIKSFAVPIAPTGTKVDNYNGTLVSDPYQGLEEDTEETKKWLQEEDQFIADYLSKIPARNLIQAQLKKLWNFERYRAVSKKGNRYFYWKNQGEQKQSTFYTQEKLTDPPRILLDPSLLSTDGKTSIKALYISENGQWLVYGTAQSGSDWTDWHIRDITNFIDLPEILQWTKGTEISFTKDGKGFFYGRFEEPAQGKERKQKLSPMRLYYHTLQTPQSQDQMIFELPEQPNLLISQQVTSDGHYLILKLNQGSDKKNMLYYKDLTKGQINDGKFLPLIEQFEATYSVVDSDGSRLYVLTNAGADRGCLMQIDLTKPDPSHFTKIIPEAKETLESVQIINHQLVARYLKDAHSEVKIFSLKGQFLRSVQLPGIGTAKGFEGKPNDTETFYEFTSFTMPYQIYRYDLKTGKSSLVFPAKLLLGSDRYVTEQVFYPSKDGTKIPMFISYKKGMFRNGKNPTYVDGYGGFARSVTPTIYIPMILWMEMGGVYAVPNLRGGGEYGEPWHLAGMKEKKQNTIDDFLAAADWLIQNQYTSSEKLVLRGNSNGGMLVGACLTQRPELFAVAIAKSGVMDLLRYQKFTGGKFWTPEYGAVENPNEFKALYAYSPLHHVKPKTKYPATFIITADHDDRVVPSHSYKFTAALQAAQAGKAPILLRVEKSGGHSINSLPLDKIIEGVADEFAFLSQELHMSWPDIAELRSELK